MQLMYLFCKDTCICQPFSSTHPAVQGMLPVDDISHLNTVIFFKHSTEPFIGNAIHRFVE
jgi:hypothetical protein